MIIGVRFQFPFQEVPPPESNRIVLLGVIQRHESLEVFALDAIAVFHVARWVLDFSSDYPVELLEPQFFTDAHVLVRYVIFLYSSKSFS